jgi:hypothetical protein
MRRKVLLPVAMSAVDAIVAAITKSASGPPRLLRTRPAAIGATGETVLAKK